MAVAAILMGCLICQIYLIIGQRIVIASSPPTIIADNGNYKKPTYKLNYVGKLEKHTPQKPKITKNDPLEPYPPAALPPMIMGRAVVPPPNGSAAPYGPTQGDCGWVWWRNVWFACLGHQKDTHKKIERWAGP